MAMVSFDSSGLSFPKFANDDPGDGLALCKTHHWLFDKGILALDDHYHFQAPSLESEAPEGVLSSLRGRDIALPADASRHPAAVTVEWHGREVLVGRCQSCMPQTCTL